MENVRKKIQVSGDCTLNMYVSVCCGDKLSMEHGHGSLPGVVSCVKQRGILT